MAVLKQQQLDADEIYSDAAALGRVRAIISLVIGSLIAIGLIIASIYFSSVASGYANVQGTVTEVSQCQIEPVGNNGSTRTVCLINYSYVAADGKTYKGQSEGSTHVVGDIITVFYLKSDPATSSLNSYETLALILGGIGGVALVGTAIYGYITLRFKAAAAAVGAGTVVGLVRGAI